MEVNIKNMTLNIATAQHVHMTALVEVVFSVTIQIPEIRRRPIPHLNLLAEILLSLRSCNITQHL